MLPIDEAGCHALYPNSPAVSPDVPKDWSMASSAAATATVQSDPYFATYFDGRTDAASRQIVADVFTNAMKILDPNAGMGSIICSSADIQCGMNNGQPWVMRYLVSS